MTRIRTIIGVATAGAAIALLAGGWQNAEAGSRAGQLPLQPPGTAVVMVHCSAGPAGAFVTPARLTISQGDSVQWRMAGNVVSDSVNISLKDSSQRWPFAGPVPHGQPPVGTGNADTVGTYHYRVALWCRGPGGVRPKTIDPDIIIQ